MVPRKKVYDSFNGQPTNFFVALVPLSAQLESTMLLNKKAGLALYKSCPWTEADTPDGEKYIKA